MIRLNSADRSLLVGTEAASLLLRYAASRPADAPADPVALHVLNERGESENVIVPVTGSLGLIPEVTDEDFGPEPENAEATLFLRSRLETATPVVAEPAAASPAPAEADTAVLPDGS
jgi:hypothetical protein